MPSRTKMRVIWGVPVLAFLACQSGSTSVDAGPPASITVDAAVRIPETVFTLPPEVVDAGDAHCVSYDIRSTDDWVRFIADHCSSLTGDLLINTPEVVELAAPTLTRVGGELGLRPGAGVTSIELPALEQVGAHLRVEGESSLTRLSLPSLTTVGGSLSVTGTSLKTLALGALTSVGGLIDVRGNPALDDLTLPLEHVAHEGIEVVDNQALRLLSLPALMAPAGPLLIQGNGRLASASLPHLTRAGGTGLVIRDNASLTALDLSLLQGYVITLKVESNPKLLELNLPLVSSVHELVIYRNDALKTVDLSALSRMESALISGRALEQLSLPNFSTVTTLRVLETALTSFELPALTAASTLNLTDNPRLSRVALPLLPKVWRMSVGKNPILSEVDLPSLRTAGEFGLGETALTKWSAPLVEVGQLSVSNHPLLVELALPSLTKTEDLTLVSVPSLRRCDLSAWASTASLFVRETRMPKLEFPALTSAKNINIDHSELTTLSMPALARVTVGLNVQDNPSLVELQLPALNHLAGLVSVRNTKLRRCLLEDLKHRSTVFPRWYFEPNDGPNTCTSTDGGWSLPPLPVPIALIDTPCDRSPKGIGTDYYFFEGGLLVARCRSDRARHRRGTWELERGGDDVHYSLDDEWGAKAKGNCWTEYTSGSVPREAFTIPEGGDGVTFSLPGCKTLTPVSNPDPHALLHGFAGDYPQTSQRRLTAAELQELSPAELRWMKNEVFARYGLKFRATDLREHFQSYEGYLGELDNVDALLSDIEKANVALLAKTEAARR